MNVFTNSALAGASGQGGGGYEIQRSLRFNSGDSTKLTRTPSSAGNRKTWTWSGWTKRTILGGRTFIFSNASSGGVNGLLCEFLGGNTLRVNNVNGSGTIVSGKTTTRLFRDTAAWYHLVIVFDSTNSTAGDRLRIYVNGVRETTFSISTDPALNADGFFNTTALTAVGWGGSLTATQGFNGQMAEIHFIDGQALTASDFGEFDNNNVWQPKEYSGGSYGTNGYYFDFSDNSSDAALGTDSSGNDNDFTVSNLSVAAGVGNDSLRDSPTNGTQTDTGIGGEVVGNYATLNALIADTAVALSNGSLNYISTSNYTAAFANIGMTSGKWYFEGTVTNRAGDAILGISNSLVSSHYIGTASSGEYSYGGVGGAIYPPATSTGYATYTTGDIISCAFDADNGELYFAKNGVWQASSDPANNTSPSFSGLTDTPYFFGVTAGLNGNWDVNFGQRAFSYTAPSGYKCLCTANLPDPTIEDGSTAFETAIWTGNSATRTISGLNHEPDLIWIKNRTSSSNHSVQDSVRGFTTGKKLSSNNGWAEGDSTNLPDWAGYVSGTTSDGFTLAKDGTNASNEWLHTNKSSDAYVAWTWDAGSSTVTNTDGSISAEVRANPSAGFSIVSYTGTAAAATIGHGLNAVPSMIMVKARDVANNGAVYHIDSDATTPEDNYLRLFSTSGDVVAGAFTGWNSTAPTANVFSVANQARVNAANDYVAYCFAPVEGYSAFGSYSGNGATDGPFVYLGFRPAFVMVKARNQTQSNWVILDDKRSEFNPMYDWLYLNATRHEYPSSTQTSDFTSNGFKIRHSQIYFNANNKEYVYAAFAEHPLKSSRAR